MGKAAREVDPGDAERQFKRTEAILSSMTPQERQKPKILNARRKRRIALGSGTQVQDVNRLLKQFREMRRVFKTFQKSGMRNLPAMFG
jgi:signal recognition particle subunit SRP54